MRYIDGLELKLAGVKADDMALCMFEVITI